MEAAKLRAHNEFLLFLDKGSKADRIPTVSKDRSQRPESYPSLKKSRQTMSLRTPESSLEATDDHSGTLAKLTDTLSPNAKPGEGVSLHCVIRSNPSPTVIWKHNNTILKDFSSFSNNAEVGVCS